MRELVICLVFIPVASALVAQQDTAQGLVVALRSVGPSGDLFPQPTVFVLVLGISVRGWGLFALALAFPGCAGGVAF